MNLSGFILYWNHINLTILIVPQLGVGIYTITTLLGIFKFE